MLRPCASCARPMSVSSGLLIRAATRSHATARSSARGTTPAMCSLCAGGPPPWLRAPRRGNGACLSPAAAGRQAPPGMSGPRTFYRRTQHTGHAPMQPDAAVPNAGCPEGVDALDRIRQPECQRSGRIRVLDRYGRSLTGTEPNNIFVSLNSSASSSSKVSHSTRLRPIW
jgi:hypothetical protein